MTPRDLYAELLLERFGPEPWWERWGRKKPPPPRHWRTVLRVADPPEVTAARRAVLNTRRREAA